jgi:signal transduction histidine kinase
VTVSDDGRGLGSDPDPVVPHHGIKLLSEFLDDLGGTVRLEQRPGGGAVVRGQIPVEIGTGG